MAEIKIEKKSTIWPWILLALLIIGLIAFFLLRDNDEAEPYADNTDNTEEVMANEVNDDATMNDDAYMNNQYALVSAYTTYVRNDEDKMGLDHDYTHAAFDKLIAAIREVAEENNYDLKVDLESAEQKSDAIKKDPMSLKHANMIKDGFMVIAKAMRNLQQAKFGGLETDIDQLDQLANSVQEDVPTLEQKDNIKSFFNTASDILSDMSNTKK